MFEIRALMQIPTLFWLRSGVFGPQKVKLKQLEFNVNGQMESFLFNREHLGNVNDQLTNYVCLAWELPVIGDNFRCQTVSSESHKKVTMSIENLGWCAR